MPEVPVGIIPLPFAFISAFIVLPLSLIWFVMAVLSVVREVGLPVGAFILPVANGAAFSTCGLGLQLLQGKAASGSVLA